jgi:hypothetical protein
MQGAKNFRFDAHLKFRTDFGPDRKSEYPFTAFFYKKIMINVLCDHFSAFLPFKKIYFTYFFLLYIKMRGKPGAVWPTPRESLFLSPKNKNPHGDYFVLLRKKNRSAEPGFRYGRGRSDAPRIRGQHLTMQRSGRLDDRMKCPWSSAGLDNPWSGGNTKRERPRTEPCIRPSRPSTPCISTG